MGVSSFNDLVKHIGHEVEIVSYGDQNDPVNVAIECVYPCSEILISFDKEESPQSKYMCVYCRLVITDVEIAQTRLKLCPTCGSTRLDDFRRVTEE